MNGFGSLSANRPRAVPPNYWTLFIGLVIFGCACDLLTKQVVFHRLGGDPEVYWLWKGYVGIQTAVNTGALFGLGQGGVAWLALISIVAVGVILYWFATSGAHCDLVMTIALGGVTGGVLGNLYDRLGLWGGYGVRDWILFCYGRFTWPNFNIADSLLVTGSLLLVWKSMRAPHAQSSEQSQTTDTL